jgi:hypothetical protein
LNILLFEKIQDVYWLLLTDKESRITINTEQKSAITNGIIWGTLTLMNRTIGRESPRKCAAHNSKPFKQSKTALTENTISINILTDSQNLPARPRDFKASLADEEKNIGNPELSDVLASLCRRLILKDSKRNFSNPRGRPISDSNPTNETRGRKSYYKESNVKQIIAQILDEQEYFENIDKAITSTNIYFQHRKFSIEAGLHQMKTYKKEFLNTYRPVFKRYGLKPSNAQINKDITDELIKKIATGLALDTKSTEEEKRAIYTQGGVIYFDHLMQLYHSTTS